MEGEDGRGARRGEVRVVEVITAPLVVGWVLHVSHVYKPQEIVNMKVGVPRACTKVPGQSGQTQ